jgi:hypothetical protein
MKRPSINALLVLVTTFGLSSCAQFQREEAPMAMPEAAPATEYQDLALVVDGVPIETLFDSPARLRQVVVSLADTENPERIQEWIDIIESPDGNAADVPASLRGIAGFSVVQVFRAYLASLTEAPFNIKARGRIDDYVYDATEQAGHLAVTVRYEIFETPASHASGVPDLVKEYHWDFEVTEDYVVVPHSGDPKDPFPNTLEHLPLDRIAGKPNENPPLPPLVNKLWAKGKGIVLRHVYEVLSPTSIVRLPDQPPNNPHPYYVSTDESCLDMMWSGPVPAVKTEPWGPPAYCLGRCGRGANPPLEIVNTGGD